jgi:hypothetical protein
MAAQATSRQPGRNEATAEANGWIYVLLAVIILAAIVLVMQIAPYA